MISEYYKWLKNKSENPKKWKPNAEGKMWIRLVKTQGRRPPNNILMPEYDGRLWLTKLQEAVLQCIERKLTIVRLHLSDPTVIPLKKLKIRQLVNFLEFKYPNLQFSMCTSPTEDLTQEEKLRITAESWQLFIATFWRK